MSQQQFSSLDLEAREKGQKQSTRAMLERLAKTYLRPHILAFIVAMILMTLAASTRGIFAHILQLVIDGMIDKKGMYYMTMLCVGIVGLFTMRGVTGYLNTVVMNKIGQKIIMRIQQDMYRHILRCDLAFFHSNHSGGLISRLTNDVNLVRGAITDCLLNSFRGGLEVIFLIGVMFYKDWHLALMVLIIFPLSTFYVSRIGKKVRSIAGKTQSATSEFSSLLSQTLQGIRHVKAYGNEGKEYTRVSAAIEKIYKGNTKIVRVGTLAGPITEILSSLATAGLVIFGYWQVAHGMNTPGDLVAFITAFILAYDPIKRLARVNAQFQTGMAAAERVFTLLDLPPSITNETNAPALKVQDYDVRLEGVSFDYADGTAALKNITIHARKNATTAIVGASGAGKSTIINLIPRFYDVKSGTITIGGMNTRMVDIASLRGQIGLVSQETVLFNDTVASNIGYGKEGASLDEIKTAATSAFADEFIQKLPQGYDTVVGEHGVKLSGGQRQRIAIARAMLRNAPILLLDEATSALDNESERAVQLALKNLERGRTTIVVAHRLSTIADADHIIVMHGGEVAEEGTHEDLLAHKGVYAKLYSLQGT